MKKRKSVIKCITNYPKVGIGIMIFKDGKILLGKRKGSHGEGEYAFPGGHLEYMESIEKCARRETMEECRIEIKNLKFHFLMNLKSYAPKHYIHINLTADWKRGVPKVLEPEKCEGWDWYCFNNLPKPMFLACKNSIKAYKSGINYIDS